MAKNYPVWILEQAKRADLLPLYGKMRITVGRQLIAPAGTIAEQRHDDFWGCAGV